MVWFVGVDKLTIEKTKPRKDAHGGWGAQTQKAKKT